MMQKVIETIQGTLGNAYEIEFQEIEKNNGYRRPAVIIREKEKTACPVVYTDGLPEALEISEIRGRGKDFRCVWQPAKRNNPGKSYLSGDPRGKERRAAFGYAA